MNTKKLASAYADAVLDFLETGVPQGIIYKDGLLMMAERSECERTPHLWVDRHWEKFVSGISVPTDRGHPEFNSFRLRASIIEALAAKKKELRLSLGISSRARSKVQTPLQNSSVDIPSTATAPSVSAPTDRLL